ncbi:MAG: hypothetical protein U5K53_08595 [Halanaerobiales bacterium]|nr:hypothetical protein [Halanaerobiales bacterium]
MEWSNIDLPDGSTYSFTVKGTFDTDIMPEETISSETNLEWSSTNGINDQEKGIF